MRRLVVAFGLLVGLTGWGMPVASAAWTAPGSGVAAARAVTLNAGNAPSANATGSTVDLSWAASTTSNGVPATGYVIKRYDSSGTVQQTIAAGTCASLVAATSCSETSVPDGVWTYSVTPAYNNWRGPGSTKTSVTVDAVAPTSSITFPVSGSAYTESGYAAGCGTASTGDVCGTADDSGSGIASVRVSIQQGTGSYWDGAGFNSASEVLLSATGTTSWSYAFAPANFPTDGSYTLRVRATDNTGNVGSAASTFTIDRTAPPTPTITSAPANPSSSTAATFEFTNTETAVGFECRLDAGTYAACTSPRSYSGLAEGSHTFDVRAVDAAGNRSPVASRTWTIDAFAPTVSITFPTSGSAYNDAGYDAGCGTLSTGDLCGTAGDSGAGVTAVDISLQQGTGYYWKGTDFTSVPEKWFTASGTTNWSYTFAAGNLPAEGQYTLRARATDATGKTTITSTTFTIDRTAPTAADIQATNGPGGTVSRIDQADTVTFSFSETMSTGSILTGWNGASTNVVVRLQDGGAANDTLTVWNATNTAQLPLGTISLGRTDYTDRNHTFGASGTASTMVQNAATIIVTLGARSSGPASLTAAGTGTMTWTPSSTATDKAANPVTTTTLTEPGTLDSDF